MSLLTRCKSLWTRILQRRVHFGDRHRLLDVMYRVRDPWCLDTDRERVRFEATNAIILREFDAVASLLELGSGEGLQSTYLSAVCNKLYGIDVSPVAVKRARERCPSATFDVGDITELDQVGGRKNFDLVVGCEILYYISNLRQFIDRMSELGKACLITYYAAHRERLDPEIALQPGVKSELIRYEETEWIVAWWVNAPALGQIT